MSQSFLNCSRANDDWTFLEGMKTLEDFQLQSSCGPVLVGSGPRLLESLRRNQKLERLSLNGIHVLKGFWTPRHPERQGMFTEEVPLETKLDLLGGFRNLKRLSFRHSWNALDDDVMQFIFRELTALEELEISHCYRLADVGISGTGPQEERVSIRRLQGQS